MFFSSSGGSEPLSVSKTDILRGIITEKLNTAAREILAVVERTVTDYEAEASGFRQEIDRQRRQLELLLPQVKHNKRALVPDLYSHEVEVVSEEPEQQPDEGEAEGHDLPPWKNDEEDEDDKQPTTIFRSMQEDLKDPDCQIPASSSSSEPLSAPKADSLRSFITEKLTAASWEILTAVESVVDDVEQTSGFRQEIDRQRRQLELLQPRVTLHREELIPDQSSPLVVGEEEEQQPDEEEADSQCLPPWPDDDDVIDEDEVQRPRRNFKSSQKDSSDPDYEIPSRSDSSRGHAVRRRSGRPRISDRQNHLNLRIWLLEDSGIEVLCKAVYKKSLVQSLKCPRDLQEEEFLDQLRSTFPQLADGQPFDVFMTDQSRRLLPLRVKALTPEEIYATIRSTGKLSIYIRLKKGKDRPSADLKNDGTSSTSQVLETEEAGSENDVGSREEPLDGDDWNPDQELQRHKKPRRRRARSDVKKAEGTKMSCKVCGVWYRLLGSLIKHTWSHVDKQQGVCGVCGEKFEAVEELKEHLKNHQDVHRCSHCEKTFVSIFTLNQHIAKHTGSSLFTCKICSKTFTNMSALNTHRWVHVEKKPHKCDICLKSFGMLSQLTAHRKMHGSGDEYRCDICSKSFNLRRSLTQHRLTHSGERLYSCKVCQRQFKLEGTLRSHMTTHTARDRTFLCHICCKTFLSKTTLMAHIKIHSSERPFVCSVCSKSFVANGELKKHARIHTGETPYECTECGRFFRQKANLDSHLRIHLGIKQYVCGVCGKACSRREHLKVHLRTHNGERPYKCTLCEKTFTQSHCLKTHMKSHQTEENPVPDPPESLIPQSPDPPES